jgi:single-strand DNA-binding protein
VARGVNRAIILGNVGKDPETRFTTAGKAVTNFSVATSESWKDKQTGEQKEQTEWHNIVVFDRLAEIVGEYVRKGSQVYVEGKITTRKWQDKDGRDRYTTEIVANEVQFLGARESSGSSSGPPGRPQNRGTGGNGGPPRGSGPPRQAERPARGQADEAGFDDDIPF